VFQRFFPGCGFYNWELKEFIIRVGLRITGSIRQHLLGQGIPMILQNSYRQQQNIERRPCGFVMISLKKILRGKAVK
jgi:hypothetical protein